MKYNSKNFKNDNYFILYDLNDEIVCYLENWEELHTKYLNNYALRNLVYQFNHNNTNVIKIIINHKEFKLATYC